MSDDEDDYVAFGKALKPLEEADKVRKKPIAVEEQIVRDVNGIRRFHGAFTGGFSAGHFNTVNTPQGWYPKQFKSSREVKSDKANQKPEDFMDDEDVGAFGFAAQVLKTKASFQRGAEPSAPPPQTGASRSAIPLGGLLEQLVKPSNSTVGETLLIKQGWRPGSGVGPRATKISKVSRLASHAKTYGCSMPSTSMEEDSSKDEEVDPMMEKYQDFLFAPDEIPLNIANPKDNFFGIGYSGLDRPGMGGGGGGPGYSVKTSLNNTNSSKKKFSISGEAFGVGADEEDDDLEVYNRGDMAQYDFSLDVRGEDRRERREEKGSRWGEDKKGQKRSIDQVDGFSPATSKSMIKKHYPSPQLPPNWRPATTPGQRQKPSRFSPAEAQQEQDKEAGGQGRKSRWDQKGHSSGSNPSIDERRSKLFPDECNSSNNNVKEEENDVPEELPDFLLQYQPEEDKQGAQSGQVPFKPFARNQAKQLRYDQYLVCVANNRREALPILQPKTMTEWEKERERVEFERASMLFKPMKGVIGSRFVSAGESEDADKGEKGLHGVVDDEEGQARRAADMKMFGQLTRTVEEWHPAKLVCVRFNVAHPYGDYSVVGTREKAKRDTGVSNVFAMVGVEEEGGSNSSQKGVKDETQVKDEPGEPIVSVKDSEPVVVKPPADLFRAIFLDSDSESDSDTEQETQDTNNCTTTSKPGNHLSTPVVPSVPKPWEKQEGNVLRSKEPARGIFANIDLDSLNRKHPDKEVIEKVSKDTRDNVKADLPPPGKSGGSLSVVNQTVRTVLGIRKEVEELSSDEDFGPKLPPTMVQKSSIVISSDSEEEEGRLTESGKKKKKKDKKKHKEKKKHKNKEKKKRSRNYSSSDSSGDRKRRRDKDRDREESVKHRKRRRHSSSSD